MLIRSGLAAANTALVASNLESNFSYGMLVSCQQEHGPGYFFFLSFCIIFFLYKPLFSLIDQFSCSETDVIRDIAW